MLEMLLEVADSSMTYRSRYLTVLQTAPVLDLLMSDELNPRSLAFQIHDFSAHCRYLSDSKAGADWPHSRQHRIEETASRLFHADVTELCEPGRRLRLSDGLAALDAALPAFSDSLANTYFSHAELERAT